MQVIKHSKKPFKSGQQVNTVKGVCKHFKTQRLAYTFREDNSHVETRMCEPIIEDADDIPREILCSSLHRQHMETKYLKSYIQQMKDANVDFMNLDTVGLQEPCYLLLRDAQKELEIRFIEALRY